MGSLRHLALLAVVAAICAASRSALAVKPLVGNPAPDFIAQAVVGREFKEVSLSDYKGKKYVVLFFCKCLRGALPALCSLSSFDAPRCLCGGGRVDDAQSHDAADPLDFTFVCPTEIRAFSDRYPEFKALDAEVLGVSVDSHHTHLAWIKTDRKVCVWGRPARQPL